jgi:hypothetical membrane protein
MSSEINWLKISGACGIIAPIIAFTCIRLAIAYYPPFSWTGNALSDLGVQEGLAPVLFNCGLVVSGLLALLFAFGLSSSPGARISGKVGAVLFALAMLALIAIGVFNENYTPMHWYASVAFFVLFPISMLLLTVAFSVPGQLRMGLFTFLATVIAAAPWVTFFTVRYVENVAIPETISALAASVWAIIVGFKMPKQASQSNK